MLSAATVTSESPRRRLYSGGPEGFECDALIWVILPVFDLLCLSVQLSLLLGSMKRKRKLITCKHGLV